MLKKIAIFSFLTVSFFLLAGPLAKAEPEIKTIHIFTSPTCPHCSEAKNFLEKIRQDNNLDFLIKDYNISRNIEQAKFFYQEYSVPANQQGLVPAIFINDDYFVGFSQQTENDISALLLNQAKEKNNLINLPILGKVNLLGLSLPVLAITLGIIDGFNVCSLGALMIILGLVIVLGSRKRIIFFGGIFILTTALIYGLLIFLWHQFFSFIAPYIRSLEIFIGLLALAGGIYLFREFYKARKSGPVCGSNNMLSRLTPKIEKIFNGGANWLILLGAVMAFATIVTIVEFPCSAFLPVLFTGILVDSNIAFSTSLFYIGLYMLFYLLDEIIIFAIAVATMKIKIVSPKFIIFFNLLAAIIFIFLGVYYLFGWLA